MVLKDFGENNLKALNAMVSVVVVDMRKHRMEGMEDRDEEDSMDLKVDTHNLEEEEEDGEGMDMDCYKGMESHDHYPFFQQSNIKIKNCVIL
jgi:23S rRNA U2552 (ribose-2'-O)-methylase RlmE/FtsJ